MVPTCGNLKKKVIEEKLEIQIQALSEALEVGDWLAERPSSKGKLILDGVMKELVRKNGGFKIWGPMVFAKNRDRVCKCSLKLGKVYGLAAWL